MLSNFYFDNNLKQWIAKPQAVFSWFQHWVEEYKKAENYVAKEIRRSSSGTYEGGSVHFEIGQNFGVSTKILRKSMACFHSRDAL